MKYRKLERTRLENVFSITGQISTIILILMGWNLTNDIPLYHSHDIKRTTRVLTIGTLWTKSAFHVFALSKANSYLQVNHHDCSSRSQGLDKSVSWDKELWYTVTPKLKFHRFHNTVPHNVNCAIKSKVWTSQNFELTLNVCSVIVKFIVEIKILSHGMTIQNIF